MIKKIILTIIGVLVFSLMLSGIAYATGVVRLPTLEGVSLSWGQITSTSTTIDADITVDNRLPFGVSAGSISILMPIYINGVHAADLNIPSLSLPRGKSTLSASTTLLQSSLPQWWPAFVQQVVNGKTINESLLIRFQPRISARVLGMTLSTGLPQIEKDVPVPIMSNLHSETPIIIGFDTTSLLDIARNPNSHFVISPNIPAYPLLTIQSWELHWGTVTTDSTQVLGSMVLVNNSPIPIPVQGLELELDMNGLSMVDVTLTPSAPQLDPGQSVTMALSATISNDNLVKWWTSHLEEGENTTATAKVGVSIVLPKAFGLPQDIPLPMIEVPAIQVKIQTHILDVLNYQIAQALGKATGQAPSPVDVQPTVLGAQLPVLPSFPSPTLPILPTTLPPIPTVIPPPTTLPVIPTIPPLPTLPTSIPTIPPLPTLPTTTPTQTPFAVIQYSFSPNPIALGGASTLTFTMTGGTAGTYTIDWWKDVTLFPDTLISSSSIQYNGVSGTISYPFIPSATGSYHVSIFLGIQLLWSQPNDASRLQVTNPATIPATTAPQTTQSQTSSSNLINGNISVNAGKYYAVPFTVTSNMTNANVTGSFVASGGSGNDIKVYIFNSVDYTKWVSGQQVNTALYVSGQVTMANLNVSIPVAGQYYLVFDNTFSIISTKQVTANIILQWSQ